METDTSFSHDAGSEKINLEVPPFVDDWELYTTLSSVLIAKKLKQRMDQSSMCALSVID